MVNGQFSITYAGIKDIIEHCTELCDLTLKYMAGLTEADMNAIYEQVLKTGKVDHYNEDRHCHYFKISFDGVDSKVGTLVAAAKSTDNLWLFAGIHYSSSTYS
jgi:hypothetical protein